MMWTNRRAIQRATNSIVRGIPLSQLGNRHLDKSVTLRTILKSQNLLTNAIAPQLRDHGDPEVVVDGACDQADVRVS